MENNTMLSENLKSTFSDLEKAIHRFNENSFNQKPNGSNWSPAMVTQHLVLAGTGIDQVLLGNTNSTEGKADGKVAQIKGIFLDFDSKFTSPKFIEPADQNYQLKEQLNKLTNISRSIISIIPDLDLSLTCTDFEMPFLGYLTRLELISFVIFHTQRHTHQLNNMAN
ncbi:DinB family protein [Pedobacter ureilyticus]|uniref:DinB family protein n=1 Tax=Pedobacter ureilyticus TaxID=1393051 RepID=A0ABW9J3F9_9SPHI|nr:DinB family protein [Pedobacter helvus]